MEQSRKKEFLFLGDCYPDMVGWLVTLNDPKAVNNSCNLWHLLLSMLDRPLMLQVKLSVIHTIHSQSNTLATGVENNATGDSKLNDNLDASGGCTPVRFNHARQANQGDSLLKPVSSL